MKTQREDHVSKANFDYRYRARTEHFADLAAVSDDYFGAEEIDIVDTEAMLAMVGAPKLTVPAGQTSALSVTAHRRVTGAIVVTAFRKAIAAHGVPASTLTDNGMVFTTRLSRGKGGRNGLENELRRLGVTQINSTPNHLRQDRTLPPNPQKMAHRPTPRRHHRRAADTTRHLHRGL